MFVITGGGSGIGRALAHALANMGHEVFIIGRHEDKLKETQSFFSSIRWLCADVSTSSGRTLIQDTLSSYSAIKGLIHNAGVIDPIVPIQKLNEESWRHVMMTNVEAPFFLTQSLFEKLKNGRVLHIGSGAAYFPVVGWSAYCVSKAALSMLTRCMQLEYQGKVAVTSVMPGIVDTPMQALVRHSGTYMASEKNAFFERLKTSNKLISPETVAAFLTWLLLKIDEQTYTAKEWDIYDRSHHKAWLVPPYTVPPLE